MSELGNIREQIRSEIKQIETKLNLKKIQPDLIQEIQRDILELEEKKSILKVLERLKSKQADSISNMAARAQRKLLTNQIQMLTTRIKELNQELENKEKQNHYLAILTHLLFLIISVLFCSLVIIIT